MDLKLILAMVLGLGGLLAGYLMLKPETKKIVSLAGRIFPDLVQKDLDAVEVRLHIGDESPLTVAAHREGERWTLTQPHQDVADTQAIEAVVNDVVKLGYRRKFDGPPDPGHGFDKPAIEIVARKVDGTLIEIALGAKAALESHVYAQVKGFSDVFVVPSDIVDHCRKPAWYWRNKRVMGVYTSNAIIVELEFPGSPEPVVLRKQGDGFWRQESPTNDRADLTVIMEFLRRLHLEVQASRFVDGAEGAPPQLADYGLDTPFLAVTVTPDMNGTPEKVSFGTAPTDFRGQRVPGLFAYRHADQRIVECSPEHLLPLQAVANTEYFRRREILEIKLGEVDRITVTEPGKAPWELLREGRVWGLSKPRKLHCQAGRPDAVLAQLQHLVAAGFVDGVDESGLAALGLDAASRIRVEIGAGEAAEALWVGGPSSRKGERYVQRDAPGNADDQIYSVAAAPLETLTGNRRGWLSMVERKIWDVGLSKELVTLRVTSREGGAELSAAWKQSVDANGAGSWALQGEGPPPAQAVGNKALDDLASGLTTLHAVQWVAEDPDAETLERYGLAPTGPKGWTLSAEVTRQVPGQPATTATIWFGAEQVHPEDDGASGRRRAMRVSPEHALQGDLVGTVRPGIFDRLRALVR